MKNLIGIMIIGLMVSSCSLFQKSSMSQEEIDAMLAENQSLKTQVADAAELEDQLALARMQADEAMLKLADCEEAAKAKVHIVVGAFKSSTYADEYSVTVGELGFDGKILPGPYNFNLVTSGSYESVKTALNELYDVRDQVIETAWIYIE